MSESWVEFTDAEVLAADSPERATVVKIKRRDDLGDICGQVIEQVREAWEMSGRELGGEGTIPAGMKSKAMALAIWRFVSEGIPKNPVLQTKERETAATAAAKYLDQIAAGEIGKASGPSIHRKRRKFSDCQQDGI